MGSGFHDFAASEILTAANVDGYLMRQTVMTFADSSARDSALSGVLDEGMYAYLEGTNELTFYTGSAWRTVQLPQTNWSPTWVNLSVGNGSQTAVYSRAGDLVYIHVILTFGTTTSVSGTVSISNLPVTGSTTGVVLGANLIDASGSDALGMCRVSSTSVTLKTSTGANINATQPFTWTTSDVICFSGSYIAA